MIDELTDFIKYKAKGLAWMKLKIVHLMVVSKFFSVELQEKVKMIGY